MLVLALGLACGEGLHVGSSSRSYPQGPHNSEAVRRDASVEPLVDYTVDPREDERPRKISRRMVPLRGPDSKNKMMSWEPSHHAILDVQHYGSSPRSGQDFGGVAMPVGGGAAGVLSRPAHSLQIATAAAAAAAAVAVGIRPMAAGAFYLLQTLGVKYSLFAKAFPWSCAVLTASVKGAMADGLAQVMFPDKTSSGKRARFKMRRNLAFTTFGFFYLGIFANFKYNVIYPAWYGHAQDAVRVPPPPPSFLNPMPRPALRKPKATQSRARGPKLILMSIISCRSLTPFLSFLLR